MAEGPHAVGGPVPPDHGVAGRCHRVEGVEADKLEAPVLALEQRGEVGARPAGPTPASTADEGQRGQEADERATIAQTEDGVHTRGTAIRARIRHVDSDTLAHVPIESADLRLRAGTEDDLALLRRIHRGAMRPHVEATWGTWDEAAQEERFLATTDPLAHEIAEVAGEPVGCQYVRVHPDALELVRIYILPAHQGRGIGTTLVQRLCASAAAEGKGVRLRVLKTNRAQELYARLGFVVEDETETHLHMRWSVRRRENL